MACALGDARGVRNIPATPLVSRPELARHLMALQNLPPAFDLTRRAEKPFAHLGRVELRSNFDDPHRSATRVARGSEPTGIAIRSHVQRANR